MRGRCLEVSPVNGWRCNRNRHTEGDHRARDPEAQRPETVGCIVVGRDAAVVEHWSDDAGTEPEDPTEDPS